MLLRREMPPGRKLLRCQKDRLEKDDDLDAALNGARLCSVPGVPRSFGADYAPACLRCGRLSMGGSPPSASPQPWLASALRFFARERVVGGRGFCYPVA